MAAKASSDGHTHVRPLAALVPIVTLVRSRPRTKEVRFWAVIVSVWLRGRVRKLCGCQHKGPA